MTKSSNFFQKRTSCGKGGDGDEISEYDDFMDTTMPEDSETQDPESEQFDFTDDESTDDDTDDGRLKIDYIKNFIGIYSIVFCKFYTV